MHEQGLGGIEYTINAQDDESLEQERVPLLALAESGAAVRHHLQFNRIDLAHKDADKAEYSLRHHKRCIDLIAAVGGTHAIVHLCLGYIGRPELMSRERAMRNLTIIVEYASAKGVLVSLENLRGGLVCTPEDFLDFLAVSGASATVDIGHIAASRCVLDGTVPAEEYITALAPHIVSAHIYDVELVDLQSGNVWHKAPDGRESFESRIRALTKAPHCGWWLIELGDAAEILRTNRLLQEIT